MAEAGTELQGQVAHLKESLTHVRNSATTARQSMQQSFREVDSAAAELAKQKQVLKELRAEFNKGKGEMGPEQRAQLSDTIKELEETAKDLTVRLVPATGRVNVRHHRDGERYRLKHEYEKFRFRTNPILIVAPLLLFMLPSYYLFRTMFQVWLLYYYVTLALREHILIVNGSNINGWWVFHHYMSIILCTTVLTWPKASATYQEFMPYFLIYCICQGFVQVLTNWYQLGRMYNLVARGEATRMDVISNEPLVDKRFAPSLSLLLPFLFLLYLFQLYNAVTLFQWYNAGLVEATEWQAPGLAVLFSILGMGNIFTTIRTYYQRWFGTPRAKKHAK